MLFADLPGTGSQKFVAELGSFTICDEWADSEKNMCQFHPRDTLKRLFMQIELLRFDTDNVAEKKHIHHSSRGLCSTRRHKVVFSRGRNLNPGLHW